MEATTAASDASPRGRAVDAVPDGMERFARFEILLNLVAVIALVVGVGTLESTAIGGSLSAALAGAFAQIPVTGPALVLVLAATTVNVGLGAFTMRAIVGRPYESWTSLLLSGLSAAVLVDCLLLFVLGPLGLFRWPLLALVHGIGLAAGILSLRPLVIAPIDVPSPARTLRFVLPGVVFAAPVLMQLASPVVPFMDVLFNHVSPVEHIRQWGTFESLTTNPSPNFGPSRTLLGYVAMQATLASLTDLPAVLSTAAFILPLTLLFAVATTRLASALFGAGAGYWSLFTVPLTFVFLRLPDSRATVLVFPLVAWAVAVLVGRPLMDERRRLVLVTAALAAGLYVHPFIAGLGVVTVGLVSVGWPSRYARVGVPATVGALLLAVPQAAATLAVDLSPMAVLPVIPLAVAGLWLAHRFASAVVVAVRLGLFAAAAFALLVVSEATRYTADGIRDLLVPFPLLSLAAIAGVALRPRNPGGAVIVIGAAVAVAAVVVARLLPAESPLVQSLQGEATPKALWYWGPYLVALAAAATLAHLASPRRADVVSHLAVGTFVLLAILPIRLGTSTVNLDNYEEHRMAESVSIAARHAQHGYWVGYPDSRTLISQPQADLLRSLLADAHSTGAGSDARILHLAESFRPWVGTPVAVFTGVVESTASLDPERSIHTEGGRLYHLNEVPELLATDFDYVLIEGAPLVGEWTDDAEAAGFSVLQANDRGVLLHRPASSSAAPPTGARP